MKFNFQTTQRTRAEAVAAVEAEVARLTGEADVEDHPVVLAAQARVGDLESDAGKDVRVVVHADVDADGTLDSKSVVDAELQVRAAAAPQAAETVKAPAEEA
jgi:hypothetical protein